MGKHPIPQSITIAAFVLGAILLLIAILHGGGFKIFGAEVDGSPGRFGRVFAGLLGVILIGIGLVTSLDGPYFNPPRAVERPLRMSPNRVSQAPRILAKRNKSRAVRLSRERQLSTNRSLGRPLTPLGRGMTRKGTSSRFPSKVMRLRFELPVCTTTRAAKEYYTGTTSSELTRAS